MLPAGPVCPTVEPSTKDVVSPTRCRPDISVGRRCAESGLLRCFHSRVLVTCARTADRDWIGVSGVISAAGLRTSPGGSGPDIPRRVCRSRGCAHGPVWAGQRACRCLRGRGGQAALAAGQELCGWPASTSERCAFEFSTNRQRYHRRIGVEVGKFRCVCDEVISTSGESPHEWLAIREQVFGASWDAGEGADAVFQKMRRMYVCPRSGHLWVFWSGFEDPPTCYEPCGVQNPHAAV